MVTRAPRQGSRFLREVFTSGSCEARSSVVSCAAPGNMQSSGALTSLVSVCQIDEKVPFDLQECHVS
jgi:hypothetical protein